MNSIYIIAEAGVNHNGEIKLAEKLVDAAAKAGADAVKFQAFQTDEMVCDDAPMADYQIENTQKQDSQYDMLKKLELDEAGHQHLIHCCNQRKISFMSSAFDLKSIDMLDTLGLPIFKIPSGEITNVPYLEKIGSLGKKVFLSTGMADLEEVQFAVELLTRSGTVMKNITLLHCCTNYPAAFTDVNLKAIQSMADHFPEAAIGYSDHTKGIEAAIAAAAMGARVIEKHFTLDKTLKGPDHVASLDPVELKGMVCAIRNIEKAMGDGVKKAAPSEIKNKAIVRKSIVAAGKIKKGEIFSEKNLTVKRPGNGISSINWHKILGRTAGKNYEPDEQIKL